MDQEWWQQILLLFFDFGYYVLILMSVSSHVIVSIILLEFNLEIASDHIFACSQNIGQLRKKNESG